MDLTNSNEESLIQMMTDRRRLADAFYSETGLRPSKARLCHRVDESGTMRSWFEPRPDDSSFVELRNALSNCRTWPSEPRSMETQRALVEFVVKSEAPKEIIEEICNNLTILMP